MSSLLKGSLLYEFHIKKGEMCVKNGKIIYLKFKKKKERKETKIDALARTAKNLNLRNNFCTSIVCRPTKDDGRISFHVIW